jgi:hypothetical protein
MSRRSLSRLILLLAVAVAPSVASAQAWLPDKGSFNATFLINDILNTQHWTSTGGTVGPTPDLRVGVQFQALEQPFALAPFVAYVTPISDYYYRSHAAQGRNVEELLIGFGAGKSLESVAAANLRADALLVCLRRESPRPSTPRWSVSAYGQFQWTQGGLDAPIPPSSPYFLDHDSLIESEYINAGLGTGFSVTPDMTFS